MVRHRTQRCWFYEVMKRAHFECSCKIFVISSVSTKLPIKCFAEDQSINLVFIMLEDMQLYKAISVLNRLFPAQNRLIETFQQN